MQERCPGPCPLDRGLHRLVESLSAPGGSWCLEVSGDLSPTVFPAAWGSSGNSKEVRAHGLSGFYFPTTSLKSVSGCGWVKAWVGEGR